MASDLNKNIFGVDISDRSLRLVQFRKKGKKIVLSSYNDLEIPAGVIKNGEIQEEDKLISLLRGLVKPVKGNKVSGKNTIVVLPETKTFITIIKVKSADKKELPVLIKKEIKNHIPLSLEEIYLDWQILKQTPNSTEVLIGAAPIKVVDSYLTVLEKSGLAPYVFEIEAAAIVRSLIANEDKKAKIIIDFGAIRTGLIIYDHQSIPFTVTLPISGNKITETIAKILKLDAKKAEKAKTVCGLDPKKCEGALLKILLQPIDNLASQIKKSITFYKTNFPKGNPISEIVLCGGGANFLNIDKVLLEKLDLPVNIGNPFTNAIQTNKISIPKNKILSYTTAIGLALRAWQKKI